MNRLIVVLAGIAMAVAAFGAQGAEEFNRVPRAWKWVSDSEVIFSYDGTYEDSTAFVFDAAKGRVSYGRTAPEKFAEFPLHPEGAVNMTYSPDSTMIAFTRDNDLYVAEIASGQETRLTFDGTELILNGYASWVYYEEILGRPSRYRAFWWSPDSRKIGFYRFDDTQVPLFPIYSAVGQDGSLRRTRYPKAGERNPEVRIGIIDVASAVAAGQNDGSSAVQSDASAAGQPAVEIVWADFDPTEDQYFGIPFWGSDSEDFYIARMPRVQNTLDLYAVSATDGSKKHIYSEQYKTWLDWISEVIFTEDGLYMARSFESGWEQIYFLSYDGGTFRRLTDGTNWMVSLVRVDERSGDVYFTAQRDSRVRSSLYKVDSDGNITALTDTTMNVTRVTFSPDGKYFAADLSNALTPNKIVVASSRNGAFLAQDGAASKGNAGAAKNAASKGTAAASKGCTIVADMAPGGYDPENYALPELVWMTTEDGFRLPAQIIYPKDFDASKKYPVHVDIYGGPNTPMVTDRWTSPFGKKQWWSENGIIEVTADCSVAGHNGREGTDLIHLDLISRPVKDFIVWADWLKALPYVDGDKIGVEGFSFGGSMTCALLFSASDSYHFGIAGGGVYDWQLYDSHYTERYMDTPERNPDGYATARVLSLVPSYPVTIGASDAPVMLKITHGTGDDNVHFQNTLQLINELQKNGKNFELMIYPDGMHGYRGYQGEHSTATDRAFWLHYLKGL